MKIKNSGAVFQILVNKQAKPEIPSRSQRRKTMKNEHSRKFQIVRNCASCKEPDTWNLNEQDYQTREMILHADQYDKTGGFNREKFLQHSCDKSKCESADSIAHLSDQQCVEILTSHLEGSYCSDCTNTICQGEIIDDLYRIAISNPSY